MWQLVETVNGEVKNTHEYLCGDDGMKHMLSEHEEELVKLKKGTRGDEGCRRLTLKVYGVTRATFVSNASRLTIDILPWVKSPEVDKDQDLMRNVFEDFGIEDSYLEDDDFLKDEEY